MTKKNNCVNYLFKMFILRMRSSMLRPFSYAEQHYWMYLHYCEGMFRVGVGLDFNKTQSNR